MTLLLLLCFIVLLLGVAFLTYGVFAFSSMRKYYKHLTEFDVYEYDIEERE